MPATGFVLASRPQMKDKELLELLQQRGINVSLDTHPLWVIGVRGYYLDITLGI
ncbi:MAG TPA: hypothetical protein VD993_11505 [Chitinophagaceae bacterium]|nr:hypothetical protein [Chitinophagaceae bacterium]